MTALLAAHEAHPTTPPFLWRYRLGGLGHRSPKIIPATPNKGLSCVFNDLGAQIVPNRSALFRFGNAMIAIYGANLHIAFEGLSPTVASISKI